jgi:pimeloyl-ACP methyl ester carboxylesterase
VEMPAYHPFRSAEAKAEYLADYDMRAERWPVASESRTVPTFYGQTFVRVSGPDDAPPLVLLPGASSNSLVWIPNIRVLSECYRTYAVDNIYDYGRSVYTRPIESPADFVNWLDELFSALELGDSINLMGLSYGGWLTSLYALRFPNRLNRIVLLVPGGTVLHVRREFWVRIILSLLPHRYFVKSLMSWLLGGKSEISRLVVESATNHLLLARRCFKRKRSVVATVLEDEDLRSIQVPTLFLVGENERLYSAQEAVQRLDRVAPHIKTEIIPNAGHDLTFVQAEMVNRKVLDFLKQP